MCLQTKMVTSTISIEKFKSPEIISVTNIKGLISYQWPKSVIEIGISMTDFGQFQAFEIMVTCSISADIKNCIDWFVGQFENLKL